MSKRILVYLLRGIPNGYGVLWKILLEECGVIRQQLQVTLEFFYRLLTQLVCFADNQNR